MCRPKLTRLSQGLHQDGYAEEDTVESISFDYRREVKFEEEPRDYLRRESGRKREIRAPISKSEPNNANENYFTL